MSPLSPSTLGVCDAPAPQPPRAASGRVWGRRGGGEEGRGRRATQNGHCSKDTCRLESQGGGQAQREARGSSHRRQACGPGEVGASRDGGGRAVGLQGGEASFLPEEEGRGGHPPRTETSMR